MTSWDLKFQEALLLSSTLDLAEVHFWDNLKPHETLTSLFSSSSISSPEAWLTEPSSSVSLVINPLEDGQRATCHLIVSSREPFFAFILKVILSGFEGEHTFKNSKENYFRIMTVYWRRKMFFFLVTKYLHFSFLPHLLLTRHPDFMNSSPSKEQSAFLPCSPHLFDYKRLVLSPPRKYSFSCRLNACR